MSINISDVFSSYGWILYTLHFLLYTLHFLQSNTRYFDDILRGLHPLFSESEPDHAVRDNAAGAVAKMIIVHPESIPLNQVVSCLICIILAQLNMNL